MKRRKLFLNIISSLIFLVLLFFLIIFLLDDDGLKITTYTVFYNTDQDIKIVHLSDLHNHKNEYENTTLIEEIDNINPDLVFLTGDIIDDKTKNLDNIKNLFKSLSSYKTYYVNGNHEKTAPLYDEFLELLPQYGITDMNNKKETIMVSNTKINILGISDPRFEKKEHYIISNTTLVREHLDLLTKDLDDNLTILLAHRPDLFPIISEYNIDYVFTGHTHAGQINLPNYTSIFVPNQGLFPKYDYGMFTENNTTMIITSGLGSSTLDVRVNAKAEIVLFVIKKE